MPKSSNQNSKPSGGTRSSRWDTGSIIALFPELPADYQGLFCDAYEHIGQHGGACYYGVIQATKPVTTSFDARLEAEFQPAGSVARAMPDWTLPATRRLRNRRQPESPGR